MPVIQRLKIQNFRGIRDFDISLNGKSAAFIGPNGTGKSSIADAIDFLLTGSIRRLTGLGASGISLAKHGCHIDSEVDDSWVEAEFVSHSKPKQRVTIRRTVKDPETLASSVTPIPNDISTFVNLAGTGAYHMLTRREVLKYIVTEPSDRLQQVSALLQLTNIDAIRKEIQGAAKTAQQAENEAKAVNDSRRSSVLGCVNPRAQTPQEVLERANGHRVKLGGPPLSRLEVSTIKAGLMPPAASTAHPLQSAATRQLLTTLNAWCKEGAKDARETIRTYVNSLVTLREDLTSMKALRSSDLIERGLALLKAEECPLCLSNWDQSELRTFLRERQTEAQSTQEILTRLNSDRQNIRAKITSIRTTAVSFTQLLNNGQETGSFDVFAKGLPKVADTLLPDPLQGELPIGDDLENALVALAPASLINAADTLTEYSNGLGDLEGIQQAWDELTNLEKAIGEFQLSRDKLEVAKQIAEELAVADKIFVESRDNVLQTTYDSISTKLATIYRKLHSEDESSFDVALTPTKAGLKLEVDFFKRGSHPPSALHSEGHQDSMGVCMFLTLTQHLSGGNAPLLILDDVLMSVDYGHRRAVAEILRTEFSGTQLIVTTHDRVWWRQLQSIGTIPRTGAYEFRQWSLAEGPVLFSDAGDMLKKAEVALNSNDVSQCALLLRRAVETHFGDICDGIGAAVRFRADGNYGAGDFVIPALKQLGDLLKTTKRATSSWGGSVAGIEDYDARRVKAARAFSEETWAVNPNIHYNEWANFTPSDLRSVLDAYKAVFEIFTCANPECGSAIWITEEDTKPTGLRCACNQTSYNLKHKPS